VSHARSTDDAGVSLAIYLLGTPRVEIRGVPQPPPRGKKAWALLAYLALAERPVPREQLASLLFAEAEDPLGALRWNLAEVRRLLTLPEGVGGSPVELALPPDAFVDVRVLRAGTWVEAIGIPGFGQELLEGVSVQASPAFEAWLLAERRYVRQQAEALLHEAALAKLAAGDGDAAIDLAARLVAMDAFDENHQELLIRSLAATGDRAGAARQLAACVELYRRELGVEPGPSVFAAAEATGVSATTTAVTGRAAARAQLDAGEAAIGAGALDAGLECLRRAAAEAHACGDLDLKARALLSLGGALAHAARGRDEEAAAALHEAIVLAEREGLGAISAEAHRELAWIEILRARYARALAQIEAATAVGGRSAIDDGYEAAALYQQGRYGAALGLFDRVVATAGEPRWIALALGEVGMIHVIRGELPSARVALERTLEIARSLAWNAFLPYPEALLGIVDLAQGMRGQARERLEHAFALGCQIRDCCWEGIAAAGLALLDESEGNVRAALDRFDDAARRSAREPDAWLWAHAFVLDLRCAFGVRHGLEQTRAWVADLETLAARTMMRGFLARAYLYRADLGDADALAAAEMVAAEVDDPILVERISGRRERPTGDGQVRGGRDETARQI
jgi:DNA-binding SARP family transcriptional activator